MVDAGRRRTRTRADDDHRMVECVLRANQLVEQIGRAETHLRAAVVDDVGELPRSQHRHRRDADRADFLDGEPRGDKYRPIRQAQRDAVAGRDAEANEHVAETVRRSLQIGVRDPLVLEQHRRIVAAARRHVHVEQLRRSIQRFGIVELRTCEHEVRPQITRRQVRVVIACTHAVLGQAVSGPGVTAPCRPRG